MVTKKHTDNVNKSITLKKQVRTLKGGEKSLVKKTNVTEMDIEEDESDTTIKLDEISMKYLLLNVFALDPIHDFHNVDNRIQNQGDIQNSFNRLIKLLDYKANERLITRGGSNELQNMDETELSKYSETVINDFVVDFTNFIFGNSLLNCLDMMKEYNETNEISTYDLQKNIIEPAIDNLDNSEYSYISAVKDIYLPKVRPLLEKAIIDENLIQHINDAETEIKQKLYQIAINDTEQPLLYDINKVIEDVNSFIPNEEDKIEITDTNNRDELQSKINSIKRKVLRLYHPDKNKEVDATDKYIKINDSIHEIILCIQDEYCMQSINKTEVNKGRKRTYDNEEQDNIQDTVFKKTRVEYTGGSGTSNSRTYFIEKLLGHNVRYFLRYTDSVNYDDKGRMNGPKLFKVPDTLENTLDKWKYYLYNTQLLMIWVKYRNLMYDDSKTEYFQKYMRSLCPDKKSYTNLKQYFGPLIEYDSKYRCILWFDADKIEESIYEIMEKLIQDNFQNNVFLHNDEIDVLLKKIKPYIKDNRRFVINNSAKTKDKNYGEWLNDHVFCPIPSVIDGMALCKYNQTLGSYNDDEYLHDSSLHIEEEKGEYFYDIDLNIKSDNKVNLNASFGKLDEEPIVISKDLDLSASSRNADLSAPNALREMIEYMLRQYNRINTKIATRETYRQVYSNFFNKLGSGLAKKVILKSIGDWSQEMYTVSKKPIDINIINQGFNVNIYNTSRQLNNFVIGITEDRLSACRMLFLQIFGRNTNQLSISGAYSKNYKLLYGNKKTIEKYLIKKVRGSGSKKSKRTLKKTKKFKKNTKKKK